MFNKNSVSDYYKNLKLTNKFEFSHVTDEAVLKILQNLDVNKSAGIDNITAIFLRNGTEILASPLAQLCNLSITTSSFPDDCKTAKIIP